MLACGMLAAAVAIAAWQLGALASLERATIDARFQVRGTQRPPASVVIVALDEETIARLPVRPPYPRSYYARLIDVLHRDGARLIAFDIAFDRPTTPGQDSRLAQAAASAGPVLFGTAEIGSGGQTLVLGGAAKLRSLHAAVGGTLLPTDPDGEPRRVPYAVKELPVLSVAAARLLGVSVSPGQFGRSGALIDYAGGAETFPMISMSAVLEGAVTARSFSGRTVLVGATARVEQDIHQTPFGAMSGVEIQANALRTVLEGVPLRPLGSLLGIVAVLVLAMAGPLAALRIRLAWAFVLSGALAAIYLLACQLAFADGHVMQVSGPLAGWLLSGAGMLTLGVLDVAGDRRRLRARFAEFSPEVVDAVLRGDRAVGLKPTDVIGGYRLTEVIGKGGMAVVYRAQQLSLDREVALKLIAPDFADDPVFRERFLRESRVAAAVEHPHVIPVYEAGEDAGLLFIAMRYVDGFDLGALLGRLGPLTPADAVRIVTQIAGALDAAHARGLVHRDVKPANVLLDEDLEHAYLTDFGIARATGAASAITSVGTFVGTPDYAAPEQIAGAEVDFRSDIYSLGGLLYHALTARPPFEREDLLAKLAAHAEAPPPRPSLVAGELAPFDAVIARAMAKLPDERPQTAGELAREARAALEQAGEGARPPLV